MTVDNFNRHAAVNLLLVSLLLLAELVAERLVFLVVCSNGEPFNVRLDWPVVEQTLKHV